LLSSLFKENIEDILDNIEEGIHIVDSSGKIVYYNKFATELDSVNPEDALGRHILEIYPSLTEKTSTIMKAIKSGKPILNYQQSFKNYKGVEIVTINSTIPIISKKRVIGALEVSKDITMVKKLTEKVVDLQAELMKEAKPEKVNEGSKAVFNFADIIGISEVMLRLKKDALTVASSPSPIMVYGETGTGKELIVHAIHNASPRRDKPFIAQNCAALPETLLESILFGTIKGSFTGAETRPGLFEIANGGTLFLDEINSMSLQLQAKLLRVIQDGNVRRVGDTRTIHVDVRIVTAINIDPRQALQDKTLRDDLFFRLSVISLKIPALREKRDDIPLLIEHFIKKYNKKLHKNVKYVGYDVEQFFMEYSWPGNVRELEHTIEGAMNIADGETINSNCLPYYLAEICRKSEVYPEEHEIKSLKETMDNLEKNLIEKALKKSECNVTKAAEILDMPRQTLQYKIGKYNIKIYDAGY
jgi:arginine utilization regulatory protein